MTDPYVADLTLAEVAAARHRTRSILRALAVPLRVLGIAYLVGAPVALVIGRDHLGSFFGPVIVLILVFSTWYYRRRARVTGVWLPVLPWLAILLPMIALAATASREGFRHDLPLLTDAGPSLANALAVLAAAAWLRSAILAVSSALMIATSVVVVSLVDGDTSVALQTLLYGLVLLVASYLLATDVEPMEAP